MAKCLIIAGFAGIGKTTTARKYDRVADLEHTPFKYDYSNQENLNLEKMKGRDDRRIKVGWEKEYINTIKRLSRDNDVLFVYIKPEMLELYERSGISYCVCWPDSEAFEKVYIPRYLERGNSQTYVDKATARYYEHVPIWEGKSTKHIILSGDQTIEDYLLENGYIKPNQRIVS